MSLVENYIHEYLENLQPFCEGELGQLQRLPMKRSAYYTKRCSSVFRRCFKYY